MVGKEGLEPPTRGLYFYFTQTNSPFTELAKLSSTEVRGATLGSI